MTYLASRPIDTSREGSGLEAGWEKGPTRRLEDEMAPLRPPGHGNADTDRDDEQQDERETYEKALH